MFFQVPELFASWLLTLLIQFPLVLFLLLNEATIITPLERSVTIIMTLFYAFEVIFGYFALRVMVNYQATKFHLQQFTNLEKIDPSEFEYYGNGFSDGLRNQWTLWFFCITQFVHNRIFFQQIRSYIWLIGFCKCQKLWMIIFCVCCSWPKKLLEACSHEIKYL